MAYSSTSLSSSTNSEVSNDSNCCSSCLECVKYLKEQNEQLVKDLRTDRISVVSSKTSLESVEARLLVFKKNKSVYEEDIKLLKREIYLRDLDITELKRKLELATKEKYEVQLTVQKFENLSKNLSKLLDKQIMDKCKIGLGYNVVPPPYTRNFMPLKSDLVYPSLDGFVDVNEFVSESVIENPIVETNGPETSKKENGALIIEDWVSDSDEENVPKVKTVEMFNKPSFAKINFVKSTEQVKSPRKTSVDKNRQNTPSPKGNKRNWNQHMSQKLESDFEMFNKACHMCGSFDHLKNDCNNWYNNGRFTKPVWTNVQRVNKQNFSKLTHPCPKRNMVPRTILTRPFNKITAANNSNFTKKVNIVKGTRVNTARPKSVLSAVKGNKRKAIKASSCWVRRPKHKGNPRQDLKDKGVIDSRCSRYMTGNKSYLTDYEEIDEGFIAFGDFKLTYESHILLKVPRKDNMYSVDLKNVVPQGGLTCLFAKATPNESNLWHRRLGHVNFKTMNKLVRGNLVRGLPSKHFEINQTRVACQKGKQHRASCIENLIDLKVKVIRCDNGTEFKNRVMNQFCEIKGRKPALSFMRPFGCPVTILNTIDHLGKFNGKADEGFFVGYSTNSKSFRVFNSRTRIVEENLHVQFSENTPNIAGSGPNWLFDIDALTKSMNNKPVIARNQSNGNAGTKACDDAGKARMETVPGKDYILLPMWPADLLFSQNSKDSPDAGFKPSREEENKDAEDLRNESGNPTKGKDSEVPCTEEPRINQEKDDNINNTNNINTASDGNSTNNVNVVSSTVNAVGTKVNVVDPKTSIKLPNDPNMPELEYIVYSDDDEVVAAEADMNNLDTFMLVSPIPTTRIHKDHPIDQIIRDLNSAHQTRRMTKNLKEHEEPKKVIQALKDPCWIVAMQDELLQFKLQKVWTLVDLPNGKRAIGTKWVYRNKKDERGIVIKNKARLVAQGYTQEEGIDYDEVFAPIAIIEAIRLFLAYASFKDFVVYQMDVKSAFLYGKIEDEVYVYQPPGFEDPDFPDKVYKEEKALHGLHKALRA
ncbi:putative ribonuclease H-like domain-containing protein [Tanacetum coccineum]